MCITFCGANGDGDNDDGDNDYVDNDDVDDVALRENRPLAWHAGTQGNPLLRISHGLKFAKNCKYSHSQSSANSKKWDTNIPYIPDTSN